MDESISDLLVTTLAEFGLSVPSEFMQTMLIQDRRFAGFKFSYDGGYAILQPDSHAVELYDNFGKLLRVVSIRAENEQETAA